MSFRNSIDTLCVETQSIRARLGGLVKASVLSLAVTLGTGAALASAQQQPTRQPERYQPADSVEGNYLSALIAGSARDTSAAATFLREALRADPRNQELIERSFIAFLADGAMPDAFRSAERIIARDPNNGLALMTLAVRALKNKQFQTARERLRGGARNRAADITSTLLTAWAFAGAGDQKRAIEAVDRLGGDASVTTFRDYHAALIHDMLGNTVEAQKRLKAAYDSDPVSLRTVDAWARLQARRGDVAGARDTYARFNRLLPNHPVIRDAMETLASAKPADMATALPRTVATAQQGAAETLFGLASAGNRDDNDSVIVIIYLRLALYLHPAHEMAIITLGDTLERAKQPDDAIAVFDRMPANSPLRSIAEVQIGLGLEQMGRKDEAIQHLEAAIKDDPGNLEALSAIGGVYRARKEFAKAAEFYEKGIAQIGTPQRHHWNLFYARGIAYERTKRWPLAEADFKKALDLIPDSMSANRALVLNYLGYSWVDQGINLDEAFMMLRKAVELKPRDGYIIDSLGWAYFRLGRYEDAVRELERAIELRPADPVINDHLGDAYWRVGRKLEARFQWNHARDLKPEPEDLPKILGKIENGLDDEAKPASAVAEPPKKNDG
ncbi:MAG: tetratricopeptide repeat protein [Hyphomicrobiales bacterium]|nr:tetratricopeptide repeat protein [Hyphomicrobiales bacterium]